MVKSMCDDILNGSDGFWEIAFATWLIIYSGQSVKTSIR